MKANTRCWVGVAAFSIVSGCTAPAADLVQVERVDSAGIEIIHSLGGDVPLNRHFEVAFSLGGEDTGPASFYRVIPQGVAVDARGNIAILDMSAFRVVVFDSTGRFVRSMGHEGAGPGEFNAPDAVAVLPDGSVAVHDFRKRGLEWFDPTGKPAGFRPLSASFQGGRIILSATGAFIPTRTTDRGAGLARYRLLRISETDTVTLVEQAQALGESAFYESCAVSMTLAPLFTPRLRWDAVVDQAVIGNGDDYVIDVYHGSELTRRLRRDVMARNVTESMARAELGEGEEWSIGGVPCTIPADELLAKRGYASSVAAVEDVAITPLGEIWTKRSSIGQEPALVDVFGSDGTYLGTLSESAPWPVAFLPDGRLLAIVRDDLDIDRVVVYSMQEGADASPVGEG